MGHKIYKGITAQKAVIAKAVFIDLPNFTSMTKAELVNYADEKNIEVNKNKTKAEIISAIKEKLNVE